LEDFAKGKEIKITFIGDAATSSSADVEPSARELNEMAEMATSI